MAERKKIKKSPVSKILSENQGNGILIEELSPEMLHRRCDPATLGFDSTSSLPDLQNVIGQPRAIRALELGSEVSGLGYNIFVLGAPGSGRTTLTQEYLKRKAGKEPVPDDWCYVNNFDNPHSPRALRLPAGRGDELRKDMRNFIEYCRREITRALESKEFTQERERLAQKLNQAQEDEFARLQELAAKYNFLIARTPFGVMLVPSIKGKPLEPEDIEKLSGEQREKLEQLQKLLGNAVEATLKELRELAIVATETLNQLTTRTIAFIIQQPMQEMQEKYAEFEMVLSYLEAVKRDIITNPAFFEMRSEGEKIPPDITRKEESRWTQRYEINLFVDNSSQQGAPVIVETHPVYHNLLGRVEHEVVMGGTRTDFSMIQAGAFHRANGGYLILPARDLLINPYAWEGVKRVLRDGCIRIIELGSQLGLLSTETLEPEPIPLSLKVVLVGTPLLYFLLQTHDEDFAKLFKVRAEFAAVMPRDQAAEREYGLFVHSVVMDNQLPPFSSEAVARIIEFSSRLAEDQEKLSTRFGRIADIVREAAYWARKEALNGIVEQVPVQAVQQAIDEAIYRSNLVDERLQEMISQDTLMIDVSGKAVGRINGLAVFSLGDFSFGRPNRLSASVAVGRRGILDIEREAKMAGPIHTKGVLILSGFLHSRYGSREALNLSASLTFEQSYGEIEGDSASTAELFALLSAIAGVPLRQDLAVTGSVNQHGQIQAIGGVNEKIEGFFFTCKAKGLTGSQGVIIPFANQRNLMLADEVVQTVEQRRFHIWAVSDVDQALELLTGLPAGQPDEDGVYPPCSFNELVRKRLQKFALALKEESENIEQESVA